MEALANQGERRAHASNGKRNRFRAKPGACFAFQTSAELVCRGCFVAYRGRGRLPVELSAPTLEDVNREQGLGELGAAGAVLLEQAL